MTPAVTRIPGRGLLAAALLLASGLLAGCASAGTSASPSYGSPATVAAAPLATSMSTTPGDTWAVLAMGGSAASEEQFWELFNRPAGSSNWKLATPPGVADNGGLVAAAEGGALTVSFLPSQDLTFSPLARTSDDGKTWGTGLLDAPIASVPDALAGLADGSAAGSTAMLALLGDGAIDQSTGSAGGWTALATPGAVAASPAGGRCQVTGLTAVAYAPSGAPLAAASCARPGVSGIFERVAGTWQAAGPQVPGGTTVRVLRLTRTSAGDTALLRATTSRDVNLLASWTSDGTKWQSSAYLPLDGGQVLASGTGAAGAVWVLLSGDRAAILAGPGAAWHELPAPPRGTSALAISPNGPGGLNGPDGPDGTDALAVSGATLSVYHLVQSGAWHLAQVIKVPIQYGSSS